MEIIQLVLEIGIILIGLYMAFFKSYFSEHGKQLALKEHVEELTKKVETVKSEIELLTKTKFDLGTNERTAILDYHAKYSDWRNTIIGLFPSVINEDNYTSIEMFFNETKTKELLSNNSGDRLILFKNTKEFIKIKKNVTIACLGLQHHVQEYFSKVAYDYMIFHHTKKQNPVEKHLEIQIEHSEKIHETLEIFAKEKLKLFKELVLLENELEAYLRRELFKDLEQ